MTVPLSWLSSEISPADIYAHRQTEDWIVAQTRSPWSERVQSRLQELEAYQNQYGIPRVLIWAQDPVEVLGAFMACAIAQVPVFLGNPQWQTQEHQQVMAIAQPHLIWRDQASQSQSAPPTPPHETGWIMIPTGGTSGTFKFAIHTWSSLSAAVAGMQNFFFGCESQPIHSCCVLPLYHVSGLMQFMRSLLTGGQLMVMPFHVFMAGASEWQAIQTFLTPDSLAPEHYFLSFVPTQLSRFLDHCPDRLSWLQRFRCILLGGAPASSDLFHRARTHHLNLAPTYGMTETAAQVMTLKPQDFLQGLPPPGEVLPHVQFNLSDATLGQLAWSGRSLYWGYYPHWDSSRYFLTDDRAERLGNGQLRLMGRASRTILSGGEKIYPEEIEMMILAMSGIEDAVVFGMPDADWGEIAIAAYVSVSPISETIFKQTIKTKVASYKYPKKWWWCSSIPRNAQGKVNLKQLQQDYYHQRGR